MAVAAACKWPAGEVNCHVPLSATRRNLAGSGAQMYGRRAAGGGRRTVAAHAVRWAGVRRGRVLALWRCARKGIEWASGCTHVAGSVDPVSCCG